MTESDSQANRERIPSSDDELDFHDSGIDFRQLRYFTRLAEDLHFGHAATSLFISQSGLSQAIAGLERALEVQLFERTQQTVELTDAGTELFRHARRLLADKEYAVQRVRGARRGMDLLRVGVALLAEPEVRPLFTALQSQHPEIVQDQTAAVSERLLAQVRDGGLHSAFVHQVPALTALDDLDWEIVRRGQLAILVSRENPVAELGSVRLAELRDERFLVNPRERAPSAFQGLKLMCSEFGGFDPNVLESTAMSTLAIDADLRPVVEEGAIAVMAAGTARALCTGQVAAVTLRPPPEFVIAVAWRRCERAAIVDRFLSFVRSYRDDHAWVAEPR